MRSAESSGFLLKASRRTFVAGLAGATAALFVPRPARAETPVKFLLDFRYEGPAAPFLLPLDKGYYRAEDLEVTIDTANGSVEPIAKVASGAYDVGFADINALIRYRDQNPNAGVKAVFMVYSRAPFAVIGRKSRGISKPKDLEGKKLGAPAPDGAFAQWKIFTQANGIDPNNMQIQPVDPQVAALKNELATLKRTLGTVAGSVHSREKAESEAAERERSERALSESVNGAMEAFASQHPDFQQLEQQIADKVTSIKSRHPTLDAAATLEWAYTEAKREADAAKRDEADKKRVADEKAAAAAAKARNAVNVRSATPTAPPPSSLKDAYNQVFQKHGMGLIQ